MATRARLSKALVHWPSTWRLTVATLVASVGLVAGSGLAVGQVTSALGAVDIDYFGLVLRRFDAAQAWPTVPFGSWRIWDSHATWPFLEPQKGHWELGDLDRMITEAQTHKVNVLLVLAHSPKWASARPTEASGYGLGFAAEPIDINDWRNYVRTVATRYKGKVAAYQIWNEPSDTNHFSGTLQQLVALTCDAYKTVKAIDPAAKVVSAGSAGGGRHIQYLNDFLAAGGAKCIDVVAHHFYVPRFGPEEMVPLIRQVREVMRKNGVDAMPLWNTETGWWIANTDGTPDHAMVAKGGWRKLDADIEAGAVIQRAFLLARAEGVARFYWYAWSNSYGWGLTDSAGNPKPATKYWTRATELMVNQQLTGCSQDASGYACNLQDSARALKTVRWRDLTSGVRREGPAAQPAALDSVPR